MIKIWEDEQSFSHFFGGVHMSYKEITKMQELLKNKDIDIYIVPTSDYHMSEYVSDYFKCRQFLSGFTGSAGTLVVLQEESFLFTDGRYFIQAQEEIEGSGITLMKMGEMGVPSLEEFVENNLPEGGVIGFDGKVVSNSLEKRLENITLAKRGSIVCEEDIVNGIWIERPHQSFNEIFVLDEKYSGESVESKLTRLRKEMKELDAEKMVITSLDNQAWLLNLRGSDIHCNPVFFSYTIVTMDEAFIYTGAKLPSEFVVKGVTRKPYFAFYEDLTTLTGKVLVDTENTNYLAINKLKQSENISFVEAFNPITVMKAVKNETEIKNLKKAHIIDGICVTKFMYWLKTNVVKGNITEISAAEYLDNLRKEAGSIEPSFDTISAYGANAAKMHYSASEESNVSLKPEGMLLVDSGGQYFEGTTDITRTFILGDIDDEMKKHYTLVVKGMFKLANAKFMYGCTGMNLDILARGALWSEGIDYKCGTGHGVGYMLNVHEGPNGFRWKRVPERDDACVLEPGMVTTDEPGVYLEGKYGIRIENELLCVDVVENEHGRFLGFETITMAPIDLDGIDTKYLDESDIDHINKYNSMVREKISPYLNEDERKWLELNIKDLPKEA